MSNSIFCFPLRVAARASLLSKTQVKEVMNGLNIPYEPVWIETTGDIDLVTPLNAIMQEDFFTKEIDDALLNNTCDIAIHSAKDLPSALKDGLKIFALTKGVDPSDVLLLRPKERLHTLTRCAKIGTSSLKRQRAVRSIRPDLVPVDIRGTIEKRIERLVQGEIDGLIIAKAALVRLNITEFYEIPLDIEISPLQGKLAVVGRSVDAQIEALFGSIDSRQERKKVLDIGLNPSYQKMVGTDVVHLPLIDIEPICPNELHLKRALKDLSDYTHLFFSSKSGVELFFHYLEQTHRTIPCLKEKKIIAVGQSTAMCLKNRGIDNPECAREQTQEGMIDSFVLMGDHVGTEPYVLLLQSRRARPFLSNMLSLQHIRHQICPLYDTRLVSIKEKNQVKIDEFDEVFFTSGSTIESFQLNFGKLPPHNKRSGIGKITRKQLCICD